MNSKLARRLLALHLGIVLLEAALLCDERGSMEAMAQGSRREHTPPRIRELSADASAEERAHFCQTDSRRLKSGLAEIYRLFEKAGSPKSIATLVSLDGRIRALFENRPSYRPCEEDSAIYDERWATMGVHIRHFGNLGYSGFLIAQAYRQNPNSRLRRYTLFSTILGTQEADDFGLMPNIDAAFRYASEFPTGPFVQQTYLIVAGFHKDLFMVLRDGERSYKLDCFRRYITREPIDRQRRKAKRIALEYYDKVRRMDSANNEVAKLRKGVANETIRAWSFCGD